MSDLPPIVFVVLDGTRKDHLSCYGYEHETSPALDAMVEESVRFENAYTPAAWSLPAHTSMFTGLFPSEHGATNVFGGELTGLPSDVPTVAESLRSQGYRTAGLSNNPWLGRQSGLDTGFELFLEWDLEATSVPSDWSLSSRERLYSRLHTLIGTASRRPLSLLKDRFFVRRPLASAERWLSRTGEPAFAFMNLMGAHNPYYPPKSAFEKLGFARPGLLERRRVNVGIMTDQQFGGGMATTNTDRVREYYDSSIRAQDDAFGAFLDSLRERGRYDEALIVVTSDHGKTLGEFDREEEPPHYLRDVNMNVPLVIKLPGQTSARRVEDPFELVSLYDFLVEGDFSPGWLVDRADEYALVEDYVPHTASDRAAVTRWRAVTDGSRKYIVDETDTEYFTEGTDVAETLVETVPDVDEMRAAMDAKTARLDTDVDRGTGEAAQLDSDAQAQLKDLGYLQ